MGFRILQIVVVTGSIGMLWSLNKVSATFYELKKIIVLLSFICVARRIKSKIILLRLQ